MDFIDAFEDLFGVGFDVGADEVDVILVVGFMKKKVLLHIGELDVDFSNPDLHMDPDRDNSN